MIEHPESSDDDSRIVTRRRVPRGGGLIAGAALPIPMVEPVLGARRMEALVQRVNALEDVGNVRDLGTFRTS